MSRLNEHDGVWRVVVRHPEENMCFCSNMRNVNTCKEWSQVDIEDIRDFIPVMTLAELADYLCRSDEEVAAKLEELKVFPRLG